MTELLTAAQMRAIEQAAIDSGEVTGLELMERAGAGVVEAIFEEWPELAKTDHRAVVLCGPGNNGGDGFVVARLLKEWGWEVEVFLYGDEGKLPADAKVNCERWREMGRINDLLQINNDDDLHEFEADVFIDALFGTGLSRPIDFPNGWQNAFYYYAREWRFNINAPRTVSIDTPSGMCSDSAKPLGGAILPMLTVTFHAPKVGHYLEVADKLQGYCGAPYCGQLQVIDIGLPKQYRLNLPNAIRETLAEPKQATTWLIDCTGQIFNKSGTSTHKYSCLLYTSPSPRDS